MSANQWGGLLLRTQARRCVGVVTKIVRGAALFNDVRHLRFRALARTKLTWVEFTPLNDFDDLEEFVTGSRAMVGEIARALGTEAWVVANSDDSGVDYLSFDAKGRKRWKAHDSQNWSFRIEKRVEKALEKAKTATEQRAVKATRKPLLAAARSRSPLGKLEAEAQLEWDACVDWFGEAKRAVWSKTVRIAEPEPRRRTSTEVGIPWLPEKPDLFNERRASGLYALVTDPTRTMVELHLPETTCERLYEASVAREIMPDNVIDSLFDELESASLEVHRRDPAVPTIERHMSISLDAAATLHLIARERGVLASDVVYTLARAL